MIVGVITISSTDGIAIIYQVRSTNIFRKEIMVTLVSDMLVRLNILSTGMYLRAEIILLLVFIVHPSEVIEKLPVLSSIGKLGCLRTCPLPIVFYLSIIAKAKTVSLPANSFERRDL